MRNSSRARLFCNQPVETNRSEEGIVSLRACWIGCSQAPTPRKRRTSSFWYFFVGMTRVPARVLLVDAPRCRCPNGGGRSAAPRSRFLLELRYLRGSGRQSEVRATARQIVRSLRDRRNARWRLSGYVSSGCVRTVCPSGLLQEQSRLGLSCQLNCPVSRGKRHAA